MRLKFAEEIEIVVDDEKLLDWRMPKDERNFYVTMKTEKGTHCYIWDIEKQTFKNQEEIKIKQMSFRVNGEEYRLLQKMIDESGLNQQKYILSRLLDKNPTLVELIEDNDGKAI